MGSINWRILRIPGLILLVILLLYPYLPWEGVKTSSTEETSLPDLFQSAMLHYNISTRALRGTGGYNFTSLIEDARRVAGNLSMEAAGYAGASGGVIGKTYRASITYMHLANASIEFYKASAMNMEVKKHIEEVLGELRTCRVDEALASWSRIQGRVEDLIEVLEAGINESLKAEPEDLLSKEHRQLYAEGLSKAYGLLDDLRILTELMKLVEDNRDVLEQACNGRGVNASKLAGGLNGLVKKLYQGRGGEYSYDLYSTINGMLAKLQDTQNTSTGTSGSGTLGSGGVGQSSKPAPGGRGAGWREPPTDD